MPYATRQGIIDFPKRKIVADRRPNKTACENRESEKKTPLSKVPAAVKSVSSSARQALHSCDVIVGREKEIEEVTCFLRDHLDAQKSGSIYVSGLPGTGKTACINYVIEKNEMNKHFHIVKINCTAFNSSKAVFKRICEELKLKSYGKNEKEAMSLIEKYLLKKHKMILMILDEIDQLESKSQSVLYKIFEWPSWQNSKFVLIGIANAMDLTDRNLPRLCGKVELKPRLLHFVPYSKDEITEILKKRLMDVGADKIFAPGAIELIAAKVAGTSGDVRRALDLGRRVIEIAEQNQNPLQCREKKNEISLITTSKLDIRSPSARTPKKLELFVNEILDRTRSPPKRKLNFSETSPVKSSVTSVGASPQKLMKSNQSHRVCLSEIELNDSNNPTENRILRKSPRKLSRGTFDEETNGRNFVTQVEKISAKLQFDEEPERLKDNSENVLRRSPRKQQFDAVNSKDVLTVVRTVFGASKNFKPNEESSFPLHQKLLICSLLLMIKRGKKRDITVGKLHQVYSKVCSKRGLTSVDKSGFIFLCRQVEVTGIIQLGKGHGTLAKVLLQWDESEVTHSLKDLNLLSSILNDASCLA
ncbi:hypothetical protein RUM43_009153 [Polyplax serrata]|uniref:Cell division control protein n=1 Tax=Polyplax serrata TaxID=468196 RepID=A0AAN8NZB3_POLSC